jgi:septum site-determining protein MinC
MKIVINSTSNKSLKTLSFESINNLNENFKQLLSIKEPLEVKIYAINELISCHQLSKIKNNFNKINIYSFCIYSNYRDTIVAGKSLQIDSTFLKEQEVKKMFLLLDQKKKEDILHKGTVRSGDRISSNGNLSIIGDVNPGAIVSAKKNIFVWGKLLGIAFAGKDGDNNASIASLYLNPLQLRIADIIAIGPKEKPKNNYPEIAVIEKKTINIKPYIVETKN